MGKMETICMLEDNEQKPTRNSPQTQAEIRNNCSRRIIRHITPITRLLCNTYIYTQPCTPANRCRQ